MQHTLKSSNRFLIVPNQIVLELKNSISHSIALVPTSDKYQLLIGNKNVSGTVTVQIALAVCQTAIEILHH